MKVATDRPPKKRAPGNPIAEATEVDDEVFRSFLPALSFHDGDSGPLLVGAQKQVQLTTALDDANENDRFGIRVVVGPSHALLITRVWCL